MIGDLNGSHPVLQRQLGHLWRQHAFEHQGQLGVLLDEFHIVPAQTGLVAALPGIDQLER